MELPALKLPQVHLPFDIPLLAHPPIDHFVIAIPVLVLLIEIINIFAKKRAIGTISFVLLVIGMVAAVGAYLTGLHDGSEVFDALTQAGQSELKEHKLLGTYLMLASAVVVVFKLLSAMIKRGLMKATYLLVLIVFVAGLFKQGHDGGELVYKYGANVARVADLDSDLSDAQDELDDANDALSNVKSQLQELKAKAAQGTTEAKQTVSKVVDTAVQKTEEAVEKVKQSAADTVGVVKQKAAEMTESAPTPEIEKVSQEPQPVPVETH